MAATATPNQLEQAMQALLVSDNATIQEAEKFFRAYLKDPACVAPMLNQMQNSPHVALRQMSPILLRKKINAHWARLDEAAHSSVKQLLLQCLSTEPSVLVRRAIVALATALAKHLVPAGQWNELINFAIQAAQSPQATHREVAMLLFFSLTETVGACMHAHFQSLKDLFIRAMADPESQKARLLALKASCAMVEYLGTDEQVLQFRELIPPMLAVVRQCLLTGDEEVALFAFEVLGEVAESPVPVLASHMPQLVQLLLDVAGAGGAATAAGSASGEGVEAELPTRDAAVLVLNALAHAKPQALMKHNLVPGIVRVMTLMCTEPDPEEEENAAAAAAAAAAAGGASIFGAGSASAAAATAAAVKAAAGGGGGEEGEEEHVSARGMAAQCLDVLACWLPHAVVFPPVMATATACIASADDATRVSGACLLEATCEGFAEPLRDSMDQVLPLLLSCVADGRSAAVRAAGLDALAAFCEHTQPEIMAYHAQMLPLVFALVDDPNTKVQDCACGVIDELCEEMTSESILPFLPDLMAKLTQVLQLPRVKVQCAALSAISSTAISAKQHFLPYYPAVASLLLPALSLTDPPLLELRGRALETMGRLAVAVGGEAFGGDALSACMTSASQNLVVSESNPECELLEFTYGFFYNCAVAMGETFAPFLPEILPCLISACLAVDDVRQSVTTDSDLATGGFGDFGDSEDEDDADADGPGARVRYRVRTALLDQKVAAVRAIGSVTQHCPAGVLPFLGDVLELLEKLSDYFHGDVRVHAVDALKHAISAVVRSTPLPAPWAPGFPASAALLPPHAQVMAAVLPIVMDRFEEELDKPVVACACDVLSHALTVLGPAAVGQELQPLLKHVRQMLRQRAPCQLVAESDDEGEEEDEEDGEGGRDSVLMDAVCDLVEFLAKAGGPSFAPLFQPLSPLLLRYCKPSRPARDRAMGLAAFAEALQPLGAAAATPYLEPLLPLVVSALAVEHNMLRRNAAVAAARFAALGCAPAFPSLLQALYPLFQSGGGDDGAAGDGAAPGGGDAQSPCATRDNAASAVAQMITAAPHALPMEQVLPVLLSALPLRADHAEDGAVYTALFSLYEARHPALMAALPALVAVLVRALAPDVGAEIEESIVANIVGLLRALFGEFGAQADQLTAGLSAEEQATLQQVLA